MDALVFEYILPSVDIILAAYLVGFHLAAYRIQREKRRIKKSIVILLHLIGEEGKDFGELWQAVSGVSRCRLQSTIEQETIASLTLMLLAMKNGKLIRAQEVQNGMGVAQILYRVTDEGRRYLQAHKAFLSS